jgi:hypothetical protein
MILELSTGGSVQDMLDDPLKAPGGRLPLATVRTDCVSAKNALPARHSLKPILTPKVDERSDVPACRLCVSCGIPSQDSSLPTAGEHASAQAALLLNPIQCNSRLTCI